MGVQLMPQATSSLRIGGWPSLEWLNVTTLGIQQRIAMTYTRGIQDRCHTAQQLQASTCRQPSAHALLQTHAGALSQSNSCPRRPPYLHDDHGRVQAQRTEASYGGV